MTEKEYDFMLKLNTFLKRQNILAKKLTIQETTLVGNVTLAKAQLPPEVFDRIFLPLVDLLNERVSTLEEMQEAAHEFAQQLFEYKGEE